MSTSRSSILNQTRGFSVASYQAATQLLHAASDPRCRVAGGSRDDAVLISSEEESDSGDLEEDWSDLTSPPPCATADPPQDAYNVRCSAAAAAVPLQQDGNWTSRDNESDRDDSSDFEDDIYFVPRSFGRLANARMPVVKVP